MAAVDLYMNLGWHCTEPEVKKKKIMDRKRSIFIVELSLFDCIGKKWVERHGDVNDHGRNIVEPHDI